MALWFKHACPFVQMRNSLTDFFSVCKYDLHTTITLAVHKLSPDNFFHEFSLTNDKNQPIVHLLNKVHNGLF